MSSYFSDRDGGGPRHEEQAVTEPPAVCPSCRSSSISTTAKAPDANSYWRCEACGEVWNVSRRKTVRRDTSQWR